MEQRSNDYLVADVLMGQIPHVVLLHVLVAQSSSHDQPTRTASMLHINHPFLHNPAAACLLLRYS